MKDYVWMAECRLIGEKWQCVDFRGKKSASRKLIDELKMHDFKVGTKFRVVKYQRVEGE